MSKNPTLESLLKHAPVNTTKKATQKILLKKMNTNLFNQVIKKINHSWDLNKAQKEMIGLFGENIIPFGCLSLKFYI